LIVTPWVRARAISALVLAGESKTICEASIGGGEEGEEEVVEDVVEEEVEASTILRAWASSASEATSIPQPLATALSKHFL